MPVVNREMERQIVEEGRRQGKSDDFIKQAILRYREKNGGVKEESVQSVVPVPQETTQPNKNALGRAVDFVKKDVFAGGVEEDTNIVGDVFRSTAGSQGLAGVAQMPGKVISQLGLLKENKKLSESNAALADLTTRAIQTARDLKDPIQKKKLLTQVRSNLETLGLGNEVYSELEKDILTPRDTIATSANAALTASTGSGSLVKNATLNSVKRLPVSTLQSVPKLLPTVEKFVNVGKSVLPRAVEQAAIGAGFTASENIRDGRPIGEDVAKGAVISAAVPFAGTVASKTGVAIKSAEAKLSQRYVDSLIKPLMKDLSYGKNPGKRVAQEGIVFNSLEEGAEKIGQKLDEIGEQMNTVSLDPKFEGKVFDFSDALSSIDKKIVELQKAPRTNAGVIQRLQDAKDDILQRVDNPDGTSSYARDLSNLTFDQVTQLKKDIGGLTKFTGNASDDKAYNMALKQSYGQTKEKINGIAPEMRELNERWADLKSAETAIKYRDKVEQRQNLIRFPSKTVAGVLTGAGIVTLNPALIAAAILEVGMDKAFSSSAFKTRMARWLAKASVKEKQSLMRDLPGIKQVLDRVFGEKSELTEGEILQRFKDMFKKKSPLPTNKTGR